MKICYVSADRGVPVGGTKGASIHIRSLINALSQLGHEIQVLTSSPGGEDQPDVPVIAVPSPGCTEDLLRLKPGPVARALGHVWNNGAVEDALTEMLATWKPDLIYERYSPFGAACGLAAKRLNLPHVLEVNAPLAWEGSQYRHQALSEAAHALEQAAFDATGRLIVVSEELRDTLTADGVDPQRITVVPNGVDANLFAPEGTMPDLGLSSDVVIGFVGSLKPWHGIDVLAEGFRILAGQRSCSLLVIGTGPESRIIRKLAKEFPDQVIHIEAVSHSEVPGYLRQMDIAVAPYPDLEHFYYSPLKVLEYMAAGRPIVASAIGQLKNLIDPGVTGVLVAPGDARALADAVDQLASNPTRREALGRAAAKSVRESHLWIHRAEQILNHTGRAA